MKKDFSHLSPEDIQLARLRSHLENRAPVWIWTPLGVREEHCDSCPVLRRSYNYPPLHFVRTSSQCTVNIYGNALLPPASEMPMSASSRDSLKMVLVTDFSAHCSFALSNIHRENCLKAIPLLSDCLVDRGKGGDPLAQTVHSMGCMGTWFVLGSLLDPG